VIAALVVGAAGPAGVVSAGVPVVSDLLLWRLLSAELDESSAQPTITVIAPTRRTPRTTRMNPHHCTGHAWVFRLWRFLFSERIQCRCRTHESIVMGP
jgi:hypothetical protein